MNPDLIVQKSINLGGDGNLHLAYAPNMSSRDKPWQATTTVKPRRHRDRRFWVWGKTPDDAMSRLYWALQGM